MATVGTAPESPLKDLDEWDDFLTGRYREGKSEEEFRQYDAEANPGVANFYKLNHENQTLDYVLQKEKQYFGLNKGERRNGMRFALDGGASIAENVSVAALAI